MTQRIVLTENLKRNIIVQGASGPLDEANNIHCRLELKGEQQPSMAALVPSLNTSIRRRPNQRRFSDFPREPSH